MFSDVPADISSTPFFNSSIYLAKQKILSGNLSFSFSVISVNLQQKSDGGQLEE